MKSLTPRSTASIVLLLVLGCCFWGHADAVAEVIRDTLEFSEDDLIFSEFEGYDVVSLRGCTHLYAQSKPYLPVMNLKYVIPNNEKLDSLRFSVVESTEVSGRPYLVYPCQPPRLFWAGGSEPAFCPPDSSVYNSSQLWPGYRATLAKQDYIFGFKILSLSLFPVQYLPSDSALYLYTHLEFELYLGNSPQGNWAQPASRRQEDQDECIEIIEKMVENPGKVVIYGPSLKIVPYWEAWSYIIITPDSLKEAFQPLADWYTRCGLRAYVQDLDSIYQNCSGWNQQEKIRNFIKDRYSDDGTRYILLGGDGDLIPPTAWQSARHTPPQYYPVPTDFYYSCLDWTWDPSGNEEYADPDPTMVETQDGGSLIEQMAVDYGPEVFVGRAPVSSSQGASDFVEKILSSYQQNPSTDYNEQKNGLLLGSFCSPWCSGGVAKDSAIFDMPGYSTNYYRLYDDAYDTASLTWWLKNGTIDQYDAVDQLNNGYYTVNHGGHGDFNLIEVKASEVDHDELTITDLDTLSNEGHGFFFSFSCASAALDKSTDSCFARHWLSNDEGGGIA